MHWQAPGRMVARTARSTQEQERRRPLRNWTQERHSNRTHSNPRMAPRHTPPDSHTHPRSILHMRSGGRLGETRFRSPHMRRLRR
jgi:hypothetical protein